MEFVMFAASLEAWRKMRYVVWVFAWVIVSPISVFGSSYSSVVLYPLSGPVESGLFGAYARSSVPGQTVGVGTISDSRALVWTGPMGAGVDLTPAGYESSFAYATCGTQQAGFGYITSGGNSQPLIWSGTAGSFVNLLPTNFFSGAVSGTNATQQVGYATASGFTAGHAMLWSGSANSEVDLNPTNIPGFTASTAIGIFGNQQVGNGYGIATSNSSHALLWNGSAATAIDLNPNGFSFSSADSTCGTQQVGYGNLSGSSNAEALVWSGTAGSAVNLSTASFLDTYALSANGFQQVGYGSANISAEGDALVWSGSAASEVNLENFLPAAGKWFGSRAFYIDSAGNIYGSAEGNYGGTSGEFAVEWSVVPEPGTMSMCLLGVPMFYGRRIRR